MSKIFIIACFCLQGLFTVLSAYEADTSKEQLTARLNAFAQAFNEGNQDLTSFWTDDAEFVRPLVGEAIEGKKEIGEFLEKRSKELKERQLKFSFKADKIEFPSEDSAIVEGVTEISNDKGLFDRNARKVELVRKEGQWYIDSVSDIQVPPAPPSHLKEIEWMIGNWADKDSEVVITFANRWDKFRNFIISRFNMSVYNLDAMEGVQVIGWDPSDQKIHSWIFDSDGGFGIGVWSKVGNNWEAALSYTLSDGKKASATNVYTPVDSTHYQFSSKDRKVGEESLPNIEPVTVVKEGA